VSERDDLFDGGYSPRHLRFYLAHWPALASIAVDPNGGRGELDALRREWEVINTDPNIFGVCICQRRGLWRDTPEEYTRGSGWQPEAADNIAALLADVERAADALPIHWQATAAVFRWQGRDLVWGVRLATHRLMGLQRPQDRLMEPPDPKQATHVVLGMMAQTLGWRSDDAERGVA